jgi:hypothetical protein
MYAISILKGMKLPVEKVAGFVVVQSSEDVFVPVFAPVTAGFGVLRQTQLL